MDEFLLLKKITTKKMIRNISREMRRYCVLCLLLCAGVTGYAQSAQNTAAASASVVSKTDNAVADHTVAASGIAMGETPDGNTGADGHATDTAGEKSPDNPQSKNSGGTASGTSANVPLDFHVKVSAFKIISQYYGLPLSVRFGWFYRKEDFSVFPNAGFSFSVADTPVLDTSVGLALRKKSFFWSGYAVYDIVPFAMHKKAADQAVYGITSFGFRFPGIKVTMPLVAGRLRKNEIIGDEWSTVTAPTVITQVSAGLQLDFFLTDLGFFKSTGTAAFYYHWIPKAAFHYYTVSVAIPASFHLYYVDIAFMYSLFHTSTVQYGKAAPFRRYAIGQTQSGMTGRSTFKTQALFKDMHLFSAEFRWYPVRITAQTNGFFLSLFADVGFGITERRKGSLLYEAGGGLGYNLYDSVPLTFQVGFNQKMQPVFYLSVVSRLSHRL